MDWNMLAPSSAFKPGGRPIWRNTSLGATLPKSELRGHHQGTKHLPVRTHVPDGRIHGCGVFFYIAAAPLKAAATANDCTGRRYTWAVINRCHELIAPGDTQKLQRVPHTDAGAFCKRRGGGVSKKRLVMQPQLHPNVQLPKQQLKMIVPPPPPPKLHTRCCQILSTRIKDNRRQVLDP